MPEPSDNSMRQPLVIYGAGWPDIVKIVDEINRVRARWLVLGFLDDTPSKHDSTFMGYPILGGGEPLRDLAEKGALFVNNVYSSTANRRLIAHALLAANCELATLVYP